LLLLEAGSFEIVSRERASAMPALNATADEERDLVAYLARLGGVSVRALASETPVGPVETAPGEWPTYNGSVSGNRHSPIDQITTANVARLAPQWSYTIPHFGLQSTPLVAGGIMYVSGPNQVHAIDARTGEPVWRYTRPRSSNPNVAGDAAKGANRGVALLGDWIFYTTDDAHLLCLNRWTGALRWQVYMPEQPQHYGATAAPLIAGDLVIAGVAGADEGIRGFVAAYRASTGSLAWRFWTVPRAGEPGSETWRGNAIELGGGSTWLTGSYDPESRIVYWPTGNPYPDTEGSEREGDNLFTNCILALDLATGKLRWHFQFTPHDLHDWDAVQPAVLVDTEFQGKPRKLLLHADRNGFFYVLDRTNGALLLAKPFAKKITWASSIGQDGRPVLLPGNVPTPEGTATCPDIRGATNWMATAYNPATRLYYLMTIENCGIYRSTDFGGGRGTKAVKRAGFDRGGNFFQVPGAEPPRRYLRAIEIQTGRVVWEIDQQVPAPNYGGVLSTAGGVVFYSESSGAFAAVDAKTGRALWHFQTGQAPTASPMTYVLDGRQYVAICAGANVWVFALPKL
jgi:alcohol dehydrogenase (cytochrome c)